MSNVCFLNINKSAKTFIILLTKLASKLFEHFKHQRHTSLIIQEAVMELRL